jgi:hypothetical protein
MPVAGKHAPFRLLPCVKGLNMKLHLDWSSPISLQNGAGQNLIYVCDLDEIPERPGVYVFGRTHGTAFEALYVGKAGSSLRSRIKQQFNNVRLMQHVRNAKNGDRVLLLGVFVSQQGQQPENCVPIMERALIRHYLELGDDLVNVQGTRLKTHEILSSGARGMVPAKIVVDQD